MLPKGSIRRFGRVFIGDEELVFGLAYGPPESLVNDGPLSQVGDGGESGPHLFIR